MHPEDAYFRAIKFKMASYLGQHSDFRDLYESENIMALGTHFMIESSGHVEYTCILFFQV